ncbi:MAG: hypothetical protein HUU37_03715 [Bdellovibrionales bacterium]|nr:hypothetical protein [Bdellovibrionales bacterium]
MTAFVPECTIHVALASHGRPAKHGWAVVLVDKGGRALVSSLRFRGIADARAVGLEAMLWGMEQALRLRSEKVHLNLAPGIDHGFLGDRVVKSRDPEVRAWENRAKEAWVGFRLSKITADPKATGFLAAGELAKIAAKGVRRWEDMDVF